MRNKGKTVAIHFRVTPADHAVLQALAKRHECNRSEMLRKLIRGAAQSEGMRE